MQYRRLGATDIEVSVISLGTMTYAEQNTQAEAFQQMDLAWDRGINLIDTAEMYPVPPSAKTYGGSEEIVGYWWTQRSIPRDRLIISTKVTGNGSHNPGFEHIRGGPRLSEAHILEAVDNSLRRLQTDYIDLYQLHWPERRTNFFGRLGYHHTEGDDGVTLEESVLALGKLLNAGKIRHYGLSNETPWGVMEVCRVAQAHGLPAPVSIQNPYNLLNRSYEVGLAEMSIREKIGLLAYSPLAFGFLTGKYYGGARPANSRLALFERFQRRYAKPNSLAAADAYVDLAKQHSIDPAVMSLAYINQQAFLTSNIIGATTIEQLKLNLQSLDTTLSSELLEGIEAIHQQYPNPAP